MAKAKRKKDAAIAQIRNKLEELLDETESYRLSLEAELAEAQAEQDPYGPLVRSLERQIVSAQSLEQLLDEEVWELIIRLANGSAYVEHARTRDYF